MPRFNNPQNSFIAGELSPRVEGRTDLDQYKHGAKEILNGVVLPSGGVIRRPGSQFVSDAGEPVRLLPFVFSQDESYVISLFNGSFVATNVDGTGAGSGSTGSPEFHTYPDTMKVQYAQSADVLWAAHPDYKPLKFIRSALNTFSAKPYDFTTESQHTAFPFRDANTTTATLAMSHTSGNNRTLTTASGTFRFQPGHLGAFFKITDSGTGITGVCKVVIAPGVDSLTATVDVKVNFGATSASTDWQESSWSDYRGWPRAVTFFENRLVFGGNESQPDTIWCSKVGNYDYFTQTPVDSGATASDIVLTNSDACSFTLSSTQVNAIQWLAGRSVLCVGTLGAEYIVQGPDPSLGLGVYNIQSRKQTTHGSKWVQPAEAYNAVHFIPRSGLKIHEFSFNFESDAYVAENLSVLADHLPKYAFGIKGRIKCVQWDETRQVLWCISEGGSLFSVTRDKKQGIAAFASHQLGGSYTTGGITGTPLVNSIAVVPSADASFDELWMCVARTIDGNTEHYVEKFGKNYEMESLHDENNGTGVDAAWFADCALEYDSGPYTALTGLGGLEGQTVSVLADGFVQSNKVVSGGGITLSVPADYVIVGLPYSTKIKTMPIEAGSVTGSAQGSMKRVDRLTIKFDRTTFAKAGPDYDTLSDIEFRTAADDISLPTPLYSGEKTIEPKGSVDRSIEVCVVQDKPLPLTVLAIYARGDTRDA